MPSHKPKSPKAGTRRTSDTKTLRQGSEEVAGVHRDQENSKKRQNLVKTRRQIIEKKGGNNFSIKHTGLRKQMKAEGFNLSD